jgi:uncharacterized protein YndB with AHSA1/START domain
VPTVELERRLVKSPQELWDRLVSEVRRSRWLGDLRVIAAEPPHRLEWTVQGAEGVIELESLGCGTKLRVRAEMDRAPAWERLQARYELERGMRALLDDLGSNSLKSG